MYEYWFTSTDLSCVMSRIDLKQLIFQQTGKNSDCHQHSVVCSALSSTDLFVRALECEEHVSHVPRDEEHGGQGHAPAHTLAPFREHVIPHGERNHLNRAEEEHALQQRP